MITFLPIDASLQDAKPGQSHKSMKNLDNAKLEYLNTIFIKYVITIIYKFCAIALMLNGGLILYTFINVK
jgi:hypothetical protein